MIWLSDLGNTEKLDASLFQKFSRQKRVLFSLHLYPSDSQQMRIPYVMGARVSCHLKVKAGLLTLLWLIKIDSIQ